MPASSERDPGTGIWTIRLSGIVTAEEALAAARARVESPGYEPSAPRMWDARETAPGQEIAPAKLRAIADSPEAGTATGRVAVLVARDVDFGMSRMDQAYSGLLPANAQVCRDHAEAVRWLEGA